MKVTSTKKYLIERINEHELDALFCAIYAKWQGHWPNDEKHNLHAAVIEVLQEEEEMQ